MDYKIEKEWTTEAGLTGIVAYCKAGGPMRDYRNGYVVLPDSHPLRGARASEIDDQVEVPGGVTWAGELGWMPGRYVVGFDHAHSWDMERPEIVSLEQVTLEVEQMALDLSAVGISLEEEPAQLPAGDEGYTIGWHSSEDHYCHVSLNGNTLFDVALYDQAVIEPDGRTARDASLAALEQLIADANRGRQP